MDTGYLEILVHCVQQLKQQLSVILCMHFLQHVFHPVHVILPHMLIWTTHIRVWDSFILVTIHPAI